MILKMSENQEELKKKALELDQQIHELEKQRMEIAKNVIKDSVGYDNFKDKIEEILKTSEIPLTWTQIKEKAEFTQKVPNNKWVRQMENDIGLKRVKDKKTKKILWNI